MNTRAIQRLSITSALSLILTMGAANAAAYSWTEILIPRGNMTKAIVDKETARRGRQSRIR